MVEGSAKSPGLYLDGNMTEGEIHPFASGEAVVYSGCFPGKEEPNEDAAALIAIDAERGVLAVADGVGGGRAGGLASGVALRELADALANVQPGESLRGQILDGFERANRAVIELGIGAATTLATVEIQGAAMRPYHTGDSAILVTGQRGKLKLLTIAHSPVGYAVESGLLEAGEAMHHEDRHLISNMVGSPDMRIEIGSMLPLAARDTLLLGSDGLFDNLHVEEIVELVRTGPLATVAQLLIAACQDRMAQPRESEPSKLDDVTFVAFRVSPSASGSAAP